jgi:hypothetical protein
MRVARCLTELPLLRSQLEGGRIVYSTARELTRVATADTESDWLRETAGMSPREVEEAVAGHKKGDKPDSPRDPDRMVKLVLEVRESTYAQFVEARTRLADERGERPTDDETVLALCRPPSDDEPGQPAYRIALTTCRTCAKTFQVGGAGREIEVPPSTLERALCDSHDLGDLEAEAPARMVASVSPRMRQHVFTRDHFMCTVPGCRSQRNLEAHHINPKSRGGKHHAPNLTTICDGHHAQSHVGKLLISGEAPHALNFRWPSDPDRISTREVRSLPSCPLGTTSIDDVARAAEEALLACPSSKPF